MTVVKNMLKRKKRSLTRPDRREFLKKLGGGLIITFTVGSPGFLKGKSSSGSNASEDFNAYLRIKEDGRVDCFSGKVELGQGAYTSLAQVLADELEVSIDMVDMVMGDTELCPYDAGTWGSMTTPYHDPLVRAAAATAREVLLDLAAQKLKVPKTQLKANEGMIFDKKDKGNSVTYASLTNGQKIIKSMDMMPQLKKSSSFNVIGKPILRRDALQKVKGEAKYAGDIYLDGMMHARTLRPPAHGADLIEVDSSAVDSMDGIEVVREGDFFAVLAKSPEEAQRAIVKVKAKWDVPDSEADCDCIFSYLKENAKDKETFEEKGNVGQASENADKNYINTFYDSYKAHASIETHSATATFENGKMTMWVSTQTPFGTREAVSKALNLKLEKVHIKSSFVGGGFGGKIYNDQAIEAARLAKLSGKQVQVVWTRKEEFMYDKFRPAAIVEIKSGLTDSGKINFWDYNVYCAGSRGAKLFYNVPNIKSVTSSGKDIHPFGTGAWRAPGNSSNTFARESQIDIMAAKAGMDPFKFRLKNMTNERVIRTLKAAIKEFGYIPQKAPSGRGWGIALGEDVNVYVAMIAGVEVDRLTGKVQVERVVCVQDMGQVVNPQGTKLQIEGGITMGLGYALTEDLKFDWGDIKTNNFDNYEITRFSMTPKIETVLIDDMDSPPLGGGEPAIVCVGAAVANAIFDACGARLYNMPMTPERVLAAMG